MNQVKSNRCYPGAYKHINSDHNLVMTKCKLKFKKLNKRKVKRLTLEKLQDEKINLNYEALMASTIN